MERFCRELLGALRMNLSVTVSEQGETVLVNFSGADRPLLLSNAAALLNSIE